jgi:hypothetical protein
VYRILDGGTGKSAAPPRHCGEPAPRPQRDSASAKR